MGHLVSFSTDLMSSDRSTNCQLGTLNLTKNRACGAYSKGVFLIQCPNGERVMLAVAAGL